jgi:hypothetical protein
LGPVHRSRGLRNGLPSEATSRRPRGLRNSVVHRLGRLYTYLRRRPRVRRRTVGTARRDAPVGHRYRLGVLRKRGVSSKGTTFRSRNIRLDRNRPGSEHAVHRFRGLRTGLPSEETSRRPRGLRNDVVHRLGRLYTCLRRRHRVRRRTVGTARRDAPIGHRYRLGVLRKRGVSSKGTPFRSSKIRLDRNRPCSEDAVHRARGLRSGLPSEETPRRPRGLRNGVVHRLGRLYTRTKRCGWHRRHYRDGRQPEPGGFRVALNHTFASRDGSGGTLPLDTSETRPPARALTSPALLSHPPPHRRERRETAGVEKGGGALSRRLGGRMGEGRGEGSREGGQHRRSGRPGVHGPALDGLPREAGGRRGDGFIPAFGREAFPALQVPQGRPAVARGVSPGNGRPHPLPRAPEGWHLGGHDATRGVAPCESLPRRLGLETGCRNARGWSRWRRLQGPALDRLIRQAGGPLPRSPFGLPGMGHGFIPAPGRRAVPVLSPPDPQPTPRTREGRQPKGSTASGGVAPCGGFMKARGSLDPGLTPRATPERPSGTRRDRKAGSFHLALNGWSGWDIRGRDG